MISYSIDKVAHILLSRTGGGIFVWRTYLLSISQIFVSLETFKWERQFIMMFRIRIYQELRDVLEL
jgi:hypothetical protein